MLKRRPKNRRLLYAFRKGQEDIVKYVSGKGKTMPLLLTEIKMPVQAEAELSALIAVQFKIPENSIKAVRIVRQSLDARKKQDIHFLVSAAVTLEAGAEARLQKRADARVKPYAPIEDDHIPEGEETPRGRIVVAGLGPAGLFAAYVLALRGYRPLVLERGRRMEERKADVQRFWTGKEIDPESNVMFGEGGAGTFSDGKLTTRIKDARAGLVLETLRSFGAPEDIVYQAKPHIGTDILQHVVKNMREEIIAQGGEIRFETQLFDICVQDGALRSVVVRQGGGEERIDCAALVLATGQAARDTYEMLYRRKIALLPKSFAVGVRIEHPQQLIDQAQFGALAGHPRLGAAEYRLAGKSGARGVYTFCMCPGGYVVGAASGKEEVVVNGMSDRARDGQNANAAVIVQVGPEDFGNGPLDGISFQRELEQQAYRAGLASGAYFAPAQRLEDFMKGRITKLFGAVTPTYRPGVHATRLDTLLPEFVAVGIRDGISAFSRQLAGYGMPDAVLTAVESRTSAPVRILRNASGEAEQARGLFPVGEGAGYAGGIVSAAVDGMHAAERVAARYKAGQ